MTRAARPHPDIELVDSERVVERGHRKTSWLVRLRDSWIRAADWEGARAERLDAGPGTIWETRVRLRVPVGTIVMRVVSEPGPELRLSPLDHLRRGTRKAPRRTTRTRFRIGANGEPVPEPLRRTANAAGCPKKR